MAEGTANKDPLSMSLDDIIAKSSSRSQGSGRSGGRGGRSSRPSGGRNSSRGAASNTILVKVRNDGIRKSTPSRRGGVRKQLYEPDEPQHIKSRKLDGDMAWSHDKAPRNAPARRELAAAFPAPSTVARGPVGSSQLVISNLDPNVSDDDIKELFGSIGELKSFAINYSREGKSQGTASVEFHSAQKAGEALKEFNGVHLDGKPMHISQIMMDGDRLNSGIQVSRPGQAAAPVRGGRAFNTAIASAGREPPASASRRFGSAAMDMS